MTRATAPVAAVIIAGRPPVIATTIAMMKEEYSPTFGSSPAMMEKLIASGIRAMPTTSPASTSLLKMRGFLRASRTVGRGA